MSHEPVAPASTVGSSSEPSSLVRRSLGGEPDVVLVAIGGAQRASSRLRVHGWVPRLEEAGFRCRVLTYYDGAPPRFGVTRRVRARFPRLTTAIDARQLWTALVESAAQAECVYLQEVLPPRSVVARIRAAGARIVFDFSDPIHLPTGPAHRLDRRVVSRFVTRPRFQAMMEAADWAIIENDRLADLVESSGCRPVVMRGPIDTERYRRSADRTRDTVRLGWTGSNGTLPFLEPLLPWITDLALEGPSLELVAFGVDRPIHAPGVRVRTFPWDEASEPEVVASFDIGLSYLPDTPWTRARGGAKLMVYMACGVPTVSSPGGIGDQVVESGRTGFLARTREEWMHALARLVHDPSLRQRMSQAARAEAVTRYSYEAYLPLMTSLLRGHPPPEQGTRNHP